MDGKVATALVLTREQHAARRERSSRASAWLLGAGVVRTTTEVHRTQKSFCTRSSRSLNFGHTIGTITFCSTILISPKTRKDTRDTCAIRSSGHVSDGISRQGSPPTPGPTAASRVARMPALCPGQRSAQRALGTLARSGIYLSGTIGR